MNFVYGNELTRAQGAVYSVNNLLQRICLNGSYEKESKFHFRVHCDRDSSRKLRDELK